MIMTDNNLEILQARHSIRAYVHQPLGEQEARKLRAEATFVNSHESGLNFQLCVGDDGPFRGVGRSYGMFRGVDNYLAVLIDPTFDHVLERAGYYAEQFVLEAVRLGLGTCFIGGTFSKAHVKCPVEVYEKIPFVVSVGQTEGARTSMVAKLAAKVAHRKTRKPRDFFEGSDEEYRLAVLEFPWLPTALYAVACAPSALNAQPVRLKMTDSPDSGRTVAAFTIDPDKYAAELGIAKYNIAFAVGGTWDWGESAPFYKD